jgi:hypothetical protein
MDYIAVLDYDHLDNGVFLASFARALSQQSRSRGLIIHGESAYTERLIQTGMMREDAVVRAVKDLNHRLIALFADQGISAIGLNGYQRSLIKKIKSDIQIDEQQLKRLPDQPHLLISNLAEEGNTGKPVSIELAEYAFTLQKNLQIEDIFVFSLDETDEFIRKDKPGYLSKNQLKDDDSELQIPDEFKEIPVSIRLTTTRLFADFPSVDGTTFISNKVKE